jgi:hypothetical protein
MEAYVEFLATCHSTFDAARTTFIARGKRGGTKLADSSIALERVCARLEVLATPGARGQVVQLRQCIFDIINGVLPSNEWSEADWQVAQNQFEILYAVIIQVARRDLDVQGDWRPLKYGVLRLPSLSSMTPLPSFNDWETVPDGTCRICEGPAAAGLFLCDDCDWEHEARSSAEKPVEESGTEPSASNA